MSSDLTLEIETIGETAVLQLHGDLTTFAEEVVEPHIHELLAAGCKRAVFDFTDVEYINSPGIAILIQVVSLMRENGGSVAAFGLNEHYRKIFRMVGLYQYIEIGNTREDVLQGNPGENHG